MNKTWKTLSEVNVNSDKERKGRFDYLSWADAWKHVQQNTESATYELSLVQKSSLETQA